MPNGYEPLSQDDKDWKMQVERELIRLARELAIAQAQLAALSQRK